ncbi:MAG: gamma-glutamylcyclotransferase [Rhodospirillales bacterium]
MTLTRDKIEQGFLQSLLAGDNPFGMRCLSDEELAASRRELLDGVDLSAGLWVFAYGSLLWNPALHLVEERAARIHGYHRRFCLWTPIGRGSHDFPGLVLALDRGGSCQGRVLRIAPDYVADELKVLWKREMVTGSYRPGWVTAMTPEGPVPAITFVMNRRAPNYAGRLDDERIAHVLAEAEGAIGPARDYLYQTVTRLRALDIHDRPLERLMAMVQGREKWAAHASGANAEGGGEVY